MKTVPSVKQKEFDRISNEFYVFLKKMSTKEKLEWLKSFYITMEVLIRFER